MARNQVSSEWNGSERVTVDVSASERDQLLADLERQLSGARGGHMTQAKERIKSFQRIETFDHPFKDGSRGNVFGNAMFLKAVRECAGGQNLWRENPLMRKYVEKSNDWLKTKALPAGMNETVGADGGFLVTPEFANQILMRTYDNDILERCTMLPLGSGNTLKIPAVDETSRADGSRFGGVTGYWRGEGASLTASQPSLAQISLTLNSLTVLVRMTNELMEDTTGVSAESFINMVVPQELSFKIGDAIVSGDGVDKPLGIRNAATLSLVSVSKETGQAAATVVADNILKMWARLHPSCQKNAIWLVDPSLSAALPKMTIGTAGAQLASYLPPGGLSDSPYASLMGRPVVVTEFCADLGTVGDIVLWDPTTYITASKQGVQTASSMHVYFSTNEMAYRFIQRIDGKSWWTSALTPKSAGSTLTNIVTLATRA